MLMPSLTYYNIKHTNSCMPSLTYSVLHTTLYTKV